MIYGRCLVHLQYFRTRDKGGGIDRLFQFLSRTPIEGLLPQNSRRTLGRRRRYTPSYTYIYIYRYRVSWVARWITTAGPTDLATALKSGLIYYYVLLLLFGYLYPYNIMPREIPRSRRYVTAQLPRDRDLIFRIGHNLGRSCYVEYYLSPQLFHGPSTISHASYRQIGFSPCAPHGVPQLWAVPRFYNLNLRSL